MNNLVKTVSFLIAFLIGASTLQIHAQEEPVKGILYEVSGNGLKKPSYLYGTFHLLKSDYLKEVPGLMGYFDKAKGVVVEVDIKAEDFQVMQRQMIMPDHKISEYLTKEEADVIDSKLVESVGVGLNFMEHMKPAAIVLTLSTAFPANVKAKLDKYNGTAMDLHLIEEAKTKKKTLTALETIDEQVALLFGDSISVQVQNMKKYIAQIDEADTTTNRLVDMYFAHDMAGMYALSMDGKDYMGDMQKLLYDRNNRWMQKLPGLIKKQPQFIAVGAMHLGGPQGLVVQLRKLGYTVTVIN